MTTLCYESIISHHGVKGQRWGVRRFQNPDGSLTKQGKAREKGIRVKRQLAKKYIGKDVSKNDVDTSQSVPKNDLTFNKGSKVSHVTPVDFKKLKDGQDLFVSADEFDKNLYRTFLTTKMMSKGFKTKISEVEFSLKKDLKAPSDSKQKLIYENTQKSNTELFNKDMKDRFGKDSYTYNDFVKSLDKPSKSKTEFIKSLKREGYNAILDTHDITDTWMQAKTPLIVIDAIDVLGDMKVSQITPKDLESSLEYIIKNKQR